jgi:hypothetical protein
MGHRIVKDEEAGALSGRLNEASMHRARIEKGVACEPIV